MTPNSISRPAITKLLIGAVLMLGLLGLFIALAGNASAGGDAKVTVNSTANIDDGDCEGPPNDTGTGNCTLHEAIDMVNAGDADIINFHPPVFSKEQPGVINVCDSEGAGELPFIERDLIIDSKDSGVIIDGGDKDGDCPDSADYGLFASNFDNGFDFELNGGKNFTIRNIDGEGIFICGGECDDGQSLGTIEITGITVDNVEDVGIFIIGSNLESGSITNNEISSNDSDGVNVFINACAGNDCLLTDSVLDINGNRIEGGVDVVLAGEAEVASAPTGATGVNVEYDGTLNVDTVPAGAVIGGGTKITASVSQNEVINGAEQGVLIEFFGCGQDAGVNFHVDENEEINGIADAAVDVNVNADNCEKTAAGAVAGGPLVAPGDTSENFDVAVTVNGNGDIENSAAGDDAVSVFVAICCEQSDSSSTVQVNGNGRITGEEDGIDIDSFVCCGDGNVTDTSVNNNDEITGESSNAIEVTDAAGSSDVASGAGGTGSDADDNVCTLTVDGNNEIDGVGGDAIDLHCFAGTFGEVGSGPFTPVEEVAGGGLSSGDNNVTNVYVTNNIDIDGDSDGVDVHAGAGSQDGEGDGNLATITVSGNGEITGDNSDGLDLRVGAGSADEEGDDNATEVVIEENQSIDGNSGEGIDINSYAGGVTDGSEGNSTSVTIIQNGDIEGLGSSGAGIELDNVVCCDPANTNTIDILNNKGEITGHDDDGIEIRTCCSFNTITIMDNDGNIRGGDNNGLDLEICGTSSTFIPSGTVAGAGGPNGFNQCLQDSVTLLTVINNSFSDSADDGISIQGGRFADEDMGIKSVISNNIIEGNGNDGIDVDSASGLNIGPANEIFENGTSNSTSDDDFSRGGAFSRDDAGDSGIEIDWWLGGCEWWEKGGDIKFPANGNTITQNMIYDNFSLGIDLVGFDPDSEFFFDECSTSDPDDGGLENEGVVGCLPFQLTSINPNDCIPFPTLETQSGDKLIGVACSLCTVEVFWADDDPANNDDEFGVPHGEGAEYIISGEADVDGNFSIQLPCDLGPGDLTATSTDKLKNTSEFAANLVTLGTGSCATDTPPPTDTPDVTDTPVPTATPEPVKVCGDVNLDGAVNSVDASLVLQLKADMISALANESNADVNNDGAITSVDAALLLQATAGLISTDALTCG